MGRLGHRQIRPGKVFQAVTEQLNNRMARDHQMQEPSWYNAMRSFPPSETLVRTITPRHNAPNTKAKKPKKLYRPQTITYLEDSLRDTFFKDHPWELARPRVMVELDGKDHQYCDWSKGLRQPGMPLSGESVVQRQLWLMENEKMERAKAYDVVRRDFYRLRQEEEIERRVAKEEAEHVGAYFGKTKIEVGMMLEDRQYEMWKVWAGKQTAIREAREASQIETFGEDDEVDLDPLMGPPEDAEEEKAAA